MAIIGSFGRSRGRPTPLRHLSLAIVAALLVGLVSSSDVAGKTLTTFADGAPAATVHLRAPCDSAPTPGLALPLGANVTFAEVNVTRAQAENHVNGTVALDAGIQALPRNFTGLNDTIPSVRIALQVSHINNWLAARSLNPPINTSEPVVVPVTVYSCSFPRGWNLTLDNLDVRYNVGNASNRPPEFMGALPNLSLPSGASSIFNLSLSAHFADPDGDALNFSLVPSAAADPGWQYVSLSLAGDDLLITASPDWSGNLSFTVVATDPQQESASSNEIRLTVDAHNEPPVLLAQVPGFSVTSGEAHPDLLDAAAFFRDPEGAPLSFEAEPSDTSPGWQSVALAFDGSKLDVVRAGNSSFADKLCLSILARDPYGGSTASNAFCITFVAPPPIPVPVRILVDARNEPVLNASLPHSLSVVSSAPLDGGVQVEWFLDGVFVGSGIRLENVVMAEGDHTILVRFTDGGQAQELSTSVVAAAPRLDSPSPARGAAPPETDGRNGLVAWATIGVGLAAGIVAATRIEWLRFLGLGALVAGVFARLRGDSLLGHFVRGRIYQVIAEHPGIHFSELRRLAGTPNGTCVHHLRVLERAGYIKSVADGVRTRFWTTGHRLSEDEYGFAGCEKAVLEEAQRAPGLSVEELARRVERSPSATSRAVSRLAKNGYLRRESNGRKAAVYPELKRVVRARPIESVSKP